MEISHIGDDGLPYLRRTNARDPSKCLDEKVSIKRACGVRPGGKRRGVGLSAFAIVTTRGLNTPSRARLMTSRNPPPELFTENLIVFVYDALSFSPSNHLYASPIRHRYLSHALSLSYFFDRSSSFFLPLEPDSPIPSHILFHSFHR